MTCFLGAMGLALEVGWIYRFLSTGEALAAPSREAGRPR